MEIIAIIIAVVLVGIFVYSYRDTSTPPVAVSKPAPKVDKNDNGIISKAELNKLTKVQLFDLAEKKSLKVKKSGTKAAVVNEIWSQLR
tara:strand:- start:2615 stop:2878 length:264 start_codon:yes stop_codon:yes gene_type:complete